MKEMAGSNLSGKDEWKKSEIQQLIQLIDEFKTSCGSEKINSNELYMHVAGKLLESGFSRTFLQCKYKWKELISSYTEYKQTKTGDPPPFYSEIDQVLNDISVPARKNVESTFGAPWSKYETNVLIKVIRLGQFVDKLKTNEPLAVYDQIAKYLHKFGPIQRSKEDIQQRWKNLKLSYIKYIKGDFLYFTYFDIMDDLLDWESNSIAFEEDQFKDGHDYGDESYFNPEDYNGKTVSSSKRSMNWSQKEIILLLDIIEKYNIKKLKKEDISSVFDEASIQLRLLGYKRSSDQCKMKFKQLKVMYFGTLRRAVDGEENPEQCFEFFDRLQDIMQNSDAFSDTDNDNTEHYEVEYLEDHDDIEKLPEDVTETYEKDVSNSPPNPITVNTRHWKKSRTIWSRGETKHLLKLLKVRDMTGYWRRPMFESIAVEMCKAGYKRSAHMCMIKWKNLRNSLYSCERNIADGNEELCPFYNEIREIVKKNHISFMSEQNRAAAEEEEFEDDLAEDVKYHIALGLDEQSETSLPTATLKRESSYIEDSRQEENESPLKKFKTVETNTDDINKNSEMDTSKYVCNYKMDDTEHYCLSLATSFKRLSQKKQAALKIKFQKLLYEAEFEEISS